MTVSLFTFIDLFDRHLTTADHLLDKAAAHAEERGLTEADWLGWRLCDDMHPLRFQLMNLTNFAHQWPARAAGLPVGESITSGVDLAGFRAAIAEGRGFLAGLNPEQFAGRDDLPLDYTLGNGIKLDLTSAQWLTIFASTNIAFHLSMAYAILRHHGVPVGKIDMFGGKLPT
jgi:hypothetical protein